MADCRNTLIDHFRKWKGEKYIPFAMHPAIQWSKTDPFLECQDSVDWRIIDSESKDIIKNGSLVPSANETIPVMLPSSEFNGTMHIISELKCKRTYVVPSTKERQLIKMVKFCHRSQASTDLSAPIRLNVLLGTQWQINSCAYDAIITILFNIWYDPNPESATTISFEDTQCIMFNALIQSFDTHESSCQVESDSPTFSLEEIKDYIRRRLARLSEEFTFGSYTSVQSIAEYLFCAEEIVTTSDVFCPEGHDGNGRNRQSSTSNYQIIILGTTEICLQARMDDFSLELASRCMTCDTHMMKHTTFIQTPPLLAFDISNISVLSINPVLWILCDSTRVQYVLRGVIYFYNQHFTKHMVTSTGMVWFNDGIFTGCSLVYESQRLTSNTTENAVMAFYIRSPVAP